MTRPFQRHHRLPRLAIDLPGPTCAQVKVTDEEVVKARDFALAEIIKLSDSYRDMKINKVNNNPAGNSLNIKYDSIMTDPNKQMMFDKLNKSKLTIPDK